MALLYFYREPDEITVPVPTQLANDRVRLYKFEVTQNAEEGSVATSSILIDDPNGDLDIVGHRIIGVKEDAIIGDDLFVYVGYAAERKVIRGPYRTGVSRQWDVQVVDINTILERRVMVGSDCNRPAETDVQRVQWLEASNEGHLISDTRYLSTASAVSMDAVDYRGQTFKSVLDDCAQQSGKDYWVTYFGDGASAKYPWGVFGLWYGHRDLTAYSSTIALSNDLADIDSAATFAISVEGTALKRDPSRVYSGVYLPYDGGAAYVANNATALAFARRDAISPAENVKSNAKAVARGTRYLNDIDTEEDVIETSFQVPAAYVNHVRQGMRVPFKATHLPGYETPQWMRVLNRTVTQDSELTYTIKCELGTGSGDAIDHTGETIGGFLCSADGYVVPWCTGTGSTLSATIPGTNLPQDSARTVKLYHTATYRFTWTADHQHTQPGGQSDLGGAVGAGVFGIGVSATTNPQGTGTRYIFGSETAPSFDAEYGAGFECIIDSVGDPCVPMWVFEGAGYAGQDVRGSSLTCVVTYVAGPDPRFENLVGCPFG